MMTQPTQKGTVIVPTPPNDNAALCPSTETDTTVNPVTRWRQAWAAVWIAETKAMKAGGSSDE